MTASHRLAPHELAALKANHPVEAMIGARVKLGRANARGKRAGQCLCEPVRGKAPLWVDTRSQAWGCLKGGGCGGDVFDYLAQWEGLDFPSAVRRLGGDRADASPEELAQAAAERDRRRREREEAEAAELERERERAWTIWTAAIPSPGTRVDAYFRWRGLEPLASVSLRYSADEPYFDAGTDTDGRPPIIWRGPCMVAAIRRQSGVFGGVHRTWLDPRLAAGPLPDGATGKAMIARSDGTPLPAKKMRGIKRGGAIRLNDPPPGEGRVVLIIGEGIETTATALQACQRHAGGARFVGWAAGDLGNISGGGLGPSTPHPDRPGRWIPSPDPDPLAPGVMPPDWADVTIILGDGDSDPLVTRARLECARRRFEAAGRRCAVAMAPPGADFNDIARKAVAS